MRAIEPRYLSAIEAKQPELAIGLGWVQSQVDAAGLKGSGPEWERASAWFVCADSLGDLNRLTCWLGSNLLHCLTLLFLDLAHLHRWLCEAQEAELVLEPQVRLLLLESLQGPLSPGQAAQFIWDTPGLELACWDPQNHFQPLCSMLEAAGYNKQAVVNELLHYGRWNWPNMIRRLLTLERDHLFPKLPVWQGVPVVICGAGPSLCDHDLASYRDYFLVLSAGTGINVLERLGCEPHLAMMVDPFRAQFSRFCLVDRLEQPHAAGWRSNYRALECLSGPRWLLPSSQTYPKLDRWQESLGSLEGVDEGYNVVGMAVSVARRLGACQVALAGVDLALQGGELYGAQVVSSERYWQGNSSEQLSPLRGLGSHGEAVETLPKWVAEGQWLEQVAKEWREEEGVPRLYRLGSKGLALEEVPCAELKQLAQVQRDYDGWLWSLGQQSATGAGQGPQLLEAFIEEIEQSQKEIEKMHSDWIERLSHYGIDPAYGPSREQLAQPLPLTLELLFEEDRAKLESMPTYYDLLRPWDSCYRRVFEAGIDLFADQPLQWFTLWMLSQRLAFLKQGLEQLQSWCRDSAHFYVSGEV